MIEKSMKIITKSDEETQSAGEEFAKKLNPTDVVFLIGDLGSGKTTFTKGLAKGLGIDNRIISPTFVVVRRHTVRNEELGIKNKELQTAPIVMLNKKVLSWAWLLRASKIKEIIKYLFII